MKYIKATSKNPFLSNLQVENIFISEFMPDAPGDFVKIYLYAKFCAEMETEISEKEMCAQLGITEERLLEAWSYWEGLDVIRKRYIDGEGRFDFIVEFLDLKEELFSPTNEEETTSVNKTPSSKVEAKPTFGNEGVKRLVSQIESALGRTLSVSELQTIIKWVDEVGATPEVILEAVNYGLGKGASGFRYIDTVVRGWVDQGLNTQEEVQNHIDLYDQRFRKYKRIMQALGLSRNPTEEERRIMETWFQDMGYNMESVLDACKTTAGISNPNIKYVNAVLESRLKDSKKQGIDVNQKIKVSNSELKDYYEYLKDKADREAEERKQRVYKELPQIREMDEGMREIGIRLAKAMVSRDDASAKELNAELERLNEDRAICLVDNNFDINYMDPRYLCTHCNDTGIAEMGGYCQYCRDARRAEAEIWLKERNREGK